MLTDLPEFRRFSVIKFDSIKREKMIDDNKDQSRWEFNADFTKEVSNYWIKIVWPFAKEDSFFFRNYITLYHINLHERRLVSRFVKAATIPPQHSTPCLSITPVAFFVILQYKAATNNPQMKAWHIFNTMLTIFLLLMTVIKCKKKFLRLCSWAELTLSRLLLSLHSCHLLQNIYSSFFYSNNTLPEICVFFYI